MTLDDRPLVLVVDDVPEVIRMLSLELKAEGFNVTGTEVGEATFQAIEEHNPAAVLMEVMLPGARGFDVLREVKQRYGVPVIFVTSQDSEADRLYALELGADDYVTKPFQPEELSRRINHVLGRGEGAANLELHCRGGVVIDLARTTARRGSDAIALTTNEWALLRALALAPGILVGAAQLLEDVFGPEYRDEHTYLAMWIERIVRKFGSDAPIVTGTAADGYRLECATPEPRLTPSRDAL